MEKRICQERDQTSSGCPRDTTRCHVDTSTRQMRVYCLSNESYVSLLEIRSPEEAAPQKPTQSLAGTERERIHTQVGSLPPGC